MIWKGGAYFQSGHLFLKISLHYSFPHDVSTYHFIEFFLKYHSLDYALGVLDGVPWLELAFPFINGLPAIHHRGPEGYLYCINSLMYLYVCSLPSYNISEC